MVKVRRIKKQIARSIRIVNNTIASMPDLVVLIDTQKNVVAKLLKAKRGVKHVSAVKVLEVLEKKLINKRVSIKKYNRRIGVLTRVVKKLTA